jgi:integrase
LSTRTQRCARTALVKLLTAAEIRGLVGRNVGRLAKAPQAKGTARPIKAFDRPQLVALLDRLEGSPFWLPTLVAARTGLRPGEALGLAWSDLDLDDQPRLVVRRTLSHHGGAALKAPKRPRSYRTVPIPADAARRLRAHRDAPRPVAVDERWSGLVFLTPAGRPMRVDVWRKAMADAVPGAHPHRLRHTFATTLLERGLALHIVAELLGDTSAVVEGAYSHVLRTKFEIAEMLGEDLD